MRPNGLSRRPRASDQQQLRIAQDLEPFRETSRLKRSALGSGVPISDQNPSDLPD
jgi:hypothetical protein